MSAPPPAGGIHLLVADDALAEGHRSGLYLTVCGAVLLAPNLPSSCCPEGWDCDLALYCPDCVCQAAEWVAPAGSQPDLSARTVQEHDSQAVGPFAGEFGYLVLGGPAWHVGPRADCDHEPT